MASLKFCTKRACSKCDIPALFKFLQGHIVLRTVFLADSDPRPFSVLHLIERIRNLQADIVAWPALTMRFEILPETRFAHVRPLYHPDSLAAFILNRICFNIVRIASGLKHQVSDNASRRLLRIACPAQCLPYNFRVAALQPVCIKGTVLLSNDPCAGIDLLSAVFCCVNDICRSGGGFYWIIILLIN